MTTHIFRNGAVLALILAASPAILPAQDTHNVVGVWYVSVTVKDCTNGNVIRTVRSLQMFNRDGSMQETANTFLRGISVGAWNRTGNRTFEATYWFFRYKADGTFASFAKASDSIELKGDGGTLTSSGTIQDFDANNNLTSTGCFTHAATRLASPPKAIDKVSLVFEN